MSRKRHTARICGDLISALPEPEDFRLSQQSVTDWARLAREKIEREQATYEFEESNQGVLL